MEITQTELIKLLLAVLLGGLIGFEREMQAKSAGLRTFTLITVGSTVFTMISLRFGDSRVVANILPGIGFLGGGAILFLEGRVKGMTTASSIWMSAALGAAIGLGHYALAAVATGIVFIVLWLFARFDRLIDLLGSEVRTYQISYNSTNESKLKAIEAVIAKCKLKTIHRRHMKRDKDIFQGEWELRGSLARHTKFLDAMLEDQAVVELKY